MNPHHPRRAVATAPPRRWWSAAAVLVSLACALSLVAATPATAASTVGVFSSSATPKTSAVGSTRAVNLGIRFSASTNGTLVGLEFYRSSRQKRAYAATLWSADGKVLARGTFAASSRTGWQSVRFSTPVAIKAGTTYVASYLASDGRYALTHGGLASRYSRNGITIPANGGVFRFATNSAMPTTSRGSNYLVDVVFRPSAAVQPSPNPTTTSPAPSPTPTSTTTSPAPTPTATATTTPPAQDGPLTAAEARAAASRRVFFGHQSIGGNVMKGITALNDTLAVTGSPRVELTNQSTSGLPASGAVFAHAFVGANGRPMGKIQDFEAYLRAGVGSRVDVAILKFCYADIRGARGADYANVTELFNAYAAMMTRLERDFPNVTFIYATAPVENVELKPETAAYNANRAQYNALIRGRYAATGRLWDIARAESTAPDGTRITSTYNGQTHEALYRGYTSDGGHLYEQGTRAAASPLIKQIAKG